MKILAIGDVIVDIFDKDNKIQYFNGGSAFNVAYHIKNANKDFNVCVMGKCGNDIWSEAIIKNLQNENIDTQYLYKTKNILTNKIYMSLNGNDCNYDVNCPSCNKTLWKAQNAVNKNLIKIINTFDKIVLDNINDDFVKIIKNIKNKNFISYCDIDDTSITENITVEKLNDLIKKINYFDCIQINGSTFKVLSKKLNLKNIADITKYLNNSLITITNGKKGSIILHKNNNDYNNYLISNKIEKQNDNTGAGDGFMASVIMSTYKTQNNEIMLDVPLLERTSNKLISEILLHFGARPNSKPLNITIESSKCKICGREL